MLPDRVSNPGPLTYESGALPIALRGPATSGNRVKIPVWEQLATDKTDLWQFAPRQVFTPFNCLLISVAFVVLCPIGCLWVLLCKVGGGGASYLGPTV